MKNTHYTYLSSFSGKEYGFELTAEDARKGCHQGICDDDCKELQQVPYIKKQLAKFSESIMMAICAEYGIDDCQHYDRNELEQTIIWIAAGNINDETIGKIVAESNIF